MAVLIHSVVGEGEGGKQEMVVHLMDMVLVPAVGMADNLEKVPRYLGNLGFRRLGASI